MGGGGYGVLEAFRQINTCRKAPLLVTFFKMTTFCIAFYESYLSTDERGRKLAGTWKHREKEFGKTATERMIMAFTYAPFFLLFFHAIYQIFRESHGLKEGVCQRASAVPYYRILTGPSQSSNWRKNLYYLTKHAPPPPPTHRPELEFLNILWGPGTE